MNNVYKLSLSCVVNAKVIGMGVRNRSAIKSRETIRVLHGLCALKAKGRALKHNIYLHIAHYYHLYVNLFMQTN